MTPERWQRTNEYLAEVFGREDDILMTLKAEAAAAGLPDIAVDAVVGRLLMMLTSMTRGRLAVEVGTLGGYSGIWIARGLAPGGRLITIEREPKHAQFARRQFKRASLESIVNVREGDALELLPQLGRELGAAAADVVFLDAEKTEYPSYWRHVRQLIAPGGLLIMDNALGSGAWWIDDVSHPACQGADAVNRMVAADNEFAAVALPLRQGVMVARKLR